MTDPCSALNEGINLREVGDRAETYKPNGKGEGGSWRDKLTTAEQLRNRVFPPQNFIVPGILPEGLAILSGKPKAGKSFMAMDFGIGVTTGATVFGTIKPMTGDAIYAANEDTDRRLKGRMAKYLSPFTAWPDR